MFFYYKNNFLISKTETPIIEAKNILVQSIKFRDVKLNRLANGVYIKIKCNIMDNKTAPIKYLFVKNPTWKIFFFSDLHEKDKNNSNKISVLSAIVLALSSSEVVKYSHANKPKTITVEIIVVNIINPLVPFNIVSFFFLGFLCIISFVAGSEPRASAGNPSVTRLTHSICNGSNGKGNENKSEKKIIAISPKFAESKNLTNFLILS